jgi:prefoldin subunit 5
MATRMSTIDRAIGDLDRHIKELTERLDRLEQSPPENPS